MFKASQEDDIIAEILGEDKVSWKYFNLDNRSILIAEDISMKLASSVIDQILAADEQSDEPIVLHINTPGGDAWAMIMIIDCIQMTRSQVIGLVHGTASSAGFYILQACDKRLMTRFSLLFWHEMIQWIEVRTNIEMNKAAKHYEKLQKKFEEFLKNRAKISASDWKKYFMGNNDIYFDAEEALALNLVDEVLAPFAMKAPPKVKRVVKEYKPKPKINAEIKKDEPDKAK